MNEDVLKRLEYIADLERRLSAAEEMVARRRGHGEPLRSGGLWWTTIYFKRLITDAAADLETTCEALARALPTPVRDMTP